VELIADAGWVFKAHMILGMTIFLIFPFTRLVHVWSGFATVAYAFRPYQLVRSRRLNLPSGHLRPQRGLARAAAAPQAAAGSEPAPTRRPMMRGAK
jgi:nitrate reductase gamma subunit